MDASYLMTFVSSVRAIPSVTATLTRRSQQWTKEVKSEISKSSSGPFCFFWSATFSKQIWNITDTQFLVLQTAVLREAGLKFVHNVAWRISFHFIQKKEKLLLNHTPFDVLSFINSRAHLSKWHLWCSRNHFADEGKQHVSLVDCFSFFGDIHRWKKKIFQQTTVLKTKSTFHCTQQMTATFPIWFHTKKKSKIASL